MEYERYLDTEDLAAMLGVSVATIRKWVFEDKLPYRKFGRLVRFSQPEIREWAKNQTANPVRELKADNGGAK
jgi:excisionase family DNA binding protein